MVNVRNLMKEEDIDIIAEAYADYYSNSVLEEKWTKESAAKLFRYFYNHNKELFLVAYDNDKPIGVITSVLKPWWDGNHLEDGEIFVIPECRQKGVGKLLLKALFENAVSKYNAQILEAHTYEDKNGFPYSWYKKLGFETIDDWKIISGDIKEIMKKI